MFLFSGGFAGVSSYDSHVQTAAPIPLNTAHSLDNNENIMTHHRPLATLTLLAFATATAAHAQSSSLYVVQPGPPLDAPLVAPPDAPPLARQTAASRLNPAIAAASLSAVTVPEPRTFARYDLITIIIRESSTTDFDARLETHKETEVEGEITDIPRLDLTDLFNARLRPNTFPNGQVKLGIELENDWEGEGNYSRRESMTTRITARVLDVKPNGTLVLEGRKMIRSDKEALVIGITGTCRVDDIAADNTVLSTALYDLHVDKQHSGELRKATKKGIITKVLEGLFGA